jgi:hypothetical protein
MPDIEDGAHRDDDEDADEEHHKYYKEGKFESDEKVPSQLPPG